MPVGKMRDNYSAGNQLPTECVKRKTEKERERERERERARSLIYLQDLITTARNWECRIPVDQLRNHVNLNRQTRSSCDFFIFIFSPVSFDHFAYHASMSARDIKDGS